jgi:hypothetical protein
MLPATSSKDETTEALRLLIQAGVPEAIETDRAEANLCALSYQSALYPQRHIWLDATEEEISLELEDWQRAEEWDNTVVRHIAASSTDAIEIIRTWLTVTTVSQQIWLQETA